MDVYHTRRGERLVRHLNLLAFDGFVDLLDKHQGCTKSDIPQHQKHGIADNAHITKVKTGLQEAVHIRSLKVEVKTVAKDKESCRSAAQKRAPPPLVILCCQLEVGQCHRDESCHDDQNDKDNDQDTPDDVDVVAPDAGKDVVELDVDGSEGQEASHGHLWCCLTIPGQWWYLSWVLGRPTGGLECLFCVLPHDAANDG